MARTKYQPSEIESKWQARWAEEDLYAAKDNDARAKYYNLVMFPYPSGDLHIGHWYNYTGADIYGRFMRMRGFNVMSANWLRRLRPARRERRHQEQHPAAHLDARQYRADARPVASHGRGLGLGARGGHLPARLLQVDASGSSCSSTSMGWPIGPKRPPTGVRRCNTTLANEQVVNGSASAATRRSSAARSDQWLLRITKYADELLRYDGLDWPEKTRLMQTNWIGRSEGAEIRFTAEAQTERGQGHERIEIPVFTTRPDTIYGVTFFVLAPEHPLVEQLTTPEQREAVEAYREQARARDRDRAPEHR